LPKAKAEYLIDENAEMEVETAKAELQIAVKALEQAMGE
jgi:hypothetical protein